MRASRIVGQALVLSLLGACNQLVGIREGQPVGDGRCVTASDCAGLGSECATVTCEASQCITTPVAEGTLLEQQTLGDCRLDACDGEGGIVAIPAPSDADDGLPCTEDACLETADAGTYEAEHNVVATVACYTGLPSTLGVGVCAAGQQACNQATAQPEGACVGQVLPATETCSPVGLDEDCDGEEDEEGESCGCGDGVVQQAYDEQCDDGNRTEGDGCDSNCTLTACGNAITSGAEECDDGNQESGDGCDSNCTLTACGNGVTTAGEACDDGNQDDGDGCDSNCTLSGCGNGVASAAEACDDGDQDDGDGCDSNCTLTACGNGVTTAGEACDDGNQLEGDGCDSNCTLTACGNGVTTPGEACDDGNQDDTDACLSTCVAASCGDGIVKAAAPAEGCDDGNASSDDACSAQCQAQEVLGVALGALHTCALLSGGKVKCWGDNTYGQLGRGDTVDYGKEDDEKPWKIEPIELGTGLVAVEVAADLYTTCARFSTGQVKCWGSNDSGRLGLGCGENNCPFSFNNLGDGPNEMGDALPFVDLGTNQAAVQLAMGGRAACAVLASGALKCWGNNQGGQLGLGDLNSRGDQFDEMGDLLPEVPLGAPVLSVSCGGDQWNAALSETCAVLAGGAVKCWGSNSFGQLGQGDTATRGDQPGEVAAMAVVDLGTGLAAQRALVGARHVCAHLTNGRVKCWGRAQHNALGDLANEPSGGRGDAPGEMGDVMPFVDLGTLPGNLVTDLASGPNMNCAVLQSGKVKCWGTGPTQVFYGMLGTSMGSAQTQMGDALLPVDIGPGVVAVDVTLPVEGYHTCVRVASKRMKCWGSNQEGQLGLGGGYGTVGGDTFNMGVFLPHVKPFTAGW